MDVHFVLKISAGLLVLHGAFLLCKLPAPLYHKFGMHLKITINLRPLQFGQ